MASCTELFYWNNLDQSLAPTFIYSFGVCAGKACGCIQRANSYYPKLQETPRVFPSSVPGSVGKFCSETCRWSSYNLEHGSEYSLLSGFEWALSKVRESPALPCLCAWPVAGGLSSKAGCLFGKQDPRKPWRAASPGGSHCTLLAVDACRGRDGGAKGGRISQEKHCLNWSWKFSTQFFSSSILCLCIPDWSRYQEKPNPKVAAHQQQQGHAAAKAGGDFGALVHLIPFSIRSLLLCPRAAPGASAPKQADEPLPAPSSWEGDPCRGPLVQGSQFLPLEALAVVIVPIWAWCTLFCGKDTSATQVTPLPWKFPGELWARTDGSCLQAMLLPF